PCVWPMGDQPPVPRCHKHNQVVISIARGQVISTQPRPMLTGTFSSATSVQVATASMPGQTGEVSAMSQINLNMIMSM
ncbi:MAG TPA: hypothetical protein VII61_13460, partial [Ktedonobacteraceae bacterium]